MANFSGYAFGAASSVGGFVASIDWLALMGVLGIVVTMYVQIKKHFREVELHKIRKEQAKQGMKIPDEP